MFNRVLDLFDSGRLAKSLWFFGFTALGIAAISGMAWAYCRPQFERRRARGSTEASDIRAARKGSR